MARIAFYRQGRRDGGIRTGLQIERETVLGSFEEGTDEPDPVLTWFLDIECESDSLPTEPEAARQWFLDHAELIRGELYPLAKELAVGLDINSCPFRRRSSKKIEGLDVSIEVTCSALSLSEAQHIADQVLDIAERWEEHICSLPAIDLVNF